MGVSIGPGHITTLEAQCKMKCNAWSTYLLRSKTFIELASYHPIGFVLLVLIKNYNQVQWIY